MSLKTNLQQIIKDRNGEIFTLTELEAYCHKYPAKLSNAERRLRSSESPNIEKVFKNNAIVGYRYITGSGEVVSRVAHNHQVVGAIPTSPTTCCPSWDIFKVHAQTCNKLKVGTLGF